MTGALRLLPLCLGLAWPAFAIAQPLPGSLAAPVPQPCISSPFGQRRLVGPHAALFHKGVDFPAAAGTWVHPAAPGTIVALRRMGSEGLAVDVATPAPAPGRLPFVTRYAHLGSVAPALAEGQRRVGLTSRLGQVGRTGITYGTHVHVELHILGRAIDPEPFFTVGRCNRPRAQIAP